LICLSAILQGVSTITRVLSSIIRGVSTIIRGLSSIIPFLSSIQQNSTFPLLTLDCTFIFVSTMHLHNKNYIYVSLLLFYKQKKTSISTDLFSILLGDVNSHRRKPPTTIGARA
ncbi:hypothetical protein, partial [Metabacillus litoralis]|uniref:hypothetical protein n=1 Tax=Metabacillus litoralis TaxID=152268 RepID=UPI00203BCF59